jgi:hypothetical protein
VIVSVSASMSPSLTSSGHGIDRQHLVFRRSDRVGPAWGASFAAADVHGHCSRRGAAVPIAHRVAEAAVAMKLPVGVNTILPSTIATVPPAAPPTR